MAHVAFAKVAIARAHCRDLRKARLEQSALQVKQLIKRRSLVHGNVVYLVYRARLLRQGGKQICLHGVFHIAKVATGFAVAIDKHRLAGEQRRDPFGNHRGIRTLRILARAENVEIAQADRGQAIAGGEYVGVKFIHVLGDRVGRQRLANDIFELGQAGMVTISRTRSGIDETLDARIPGSDQHVEKTGDVCRVGEDRFLERTWHRAESGMMTHEVHALHRRAAIVKSLNVGFYEGEVGPRLRTHQFPYLLKVGVITGGEIIEPNDCLVEREQGFHEIAADKASRTGNQPAVLVASQMAFYLSVFGRYGLQTDLQKAGNVFAESSRWWRRGRL